MIHDIDRITIPVLRALGDMLDGLPDYTDRVEALGELVAYFSEEMTDAVHSMIGEGQEDAAAFDFDEPLAGNHQPEAGSAAASATD